MAKGRVNAVGAASHPGAFFGDSHMTVETIDGIRTIKLKDSARHDDKAQDMMTVARLWALLSGAHELRDMGVGDRRLL